MEKDLLLSSQQKLEMLAVITRALYNQEILSAVPRATDNERNNSY